MKKSFRCLICGYIHIGSQPPENCPVCGVSSAEFELYEEPVIDKSDSPGYWKCLNCEYVHEGTNAPGVCPICGVKADCFEPYSKEESSSIEIGNRRIVIIGGGIAGLSAAEEIRKNSSEAEIAIITSENHLPYYRLNLTRYLANETGKDSLEIYPEGWYRERRIKLICGKEVCEIDKVKKEIKLDDGTYLNYDSLIIAIGAHSFIPPIIGSDLKNVVTVRNIEDAEFILGKLKEIYSCICIGGGILGLEAAGAIANRGIKVTLLESAEWLMPRQLNKKASMILKKYLHDIGVEIKEDVRIKEIVGKDYCQGVILENDDVLESNLVIITAGVRPNTHLARKTGLEVDKGLVVNNRMQTSEQHIFAAGDVTEHYGMLYGLWNVAQYQGKVAALNSIGIETQFGGVPRSNVLKVLALDLFSIGEFNPLDGSYYRYEKESSSSYFLFVIRDGRIAGSIIIGDKALSIKVKRAIEKGVDFPHEIFNDAESIIEKLCNLN